MTGVDPITPAADDAPLGGRGRRSLWRRVLGWTLVAATLGVVALTVARHRHELAAVEWRIDVPLLLASLALLVLTLGWGVWLWQRLLLRLGVRLPLPVLLRIWFLASLARYVPGKIWQFVGAAQLARRHGVGAVPIVTSMIVSMGFTTAAAVVVGLPYLAFRLIENDALATAVTVLGLVTVAAAVHPSAMNLGLRLVPRALHREVLVWRAGWSDGLLLLGATVVSWAAYGCAFTLFAASVFGVGVDVLPAFIAANAIAVLAGVVAVVAPAGLGARELTLNVVLEPYLAPAGAAALLAIVSRFWVIAGEVIGAGLSVLIARRTTTGVEPPPPAR